MKQKISLQQLLDEDLLEIPEPDLEFDTDNLARVYRDLYKIAGCYLFKVEGKTVYIGISKNMGYRLKQHCSGKGNKDIGQDVENRKKVTVSVFVEPKSSLQEIYESYLIYTLKPEYNKRKTDKPFKLDIREGNHAGRPKRELTPKYLEALELLNCFSYEEVSKRTGISKSTLQRIKKQSTEGYS